jgi:LysR family transcriptional regulator, transcriptional activator for bauABCD operon
MGTRKVKLGRVSDVDIRLLRIFKAVAECGGLAAAEIQLGIGRSTISTHLADLETRLGTRLCDRGRRGFSLTSDGMKVFKSLLGLMNALDEFQHEMAALHGNVSGELNVGMVDNLVWDTDFNLRGAFARFSELAGEVHLTVQVLSPDELEKRLVEGTLHVGIAPIMHHVPSLQYESIFRETSYLYCGAGHPLFHRPDEEIDDVILSTCSYVRKAYTVASTFQEQNDRLRHHVSAFHVEAIAILVLSGAHIGFVPEHYAENWVQKGELRAIRPSEWCAEFEFGAVTRRDRSPAAAETEFVKCLLSAAKEAGSRIG